MKEKNKKGQITLFILVGFVILIAVGFMLYLKGGIKEKEVYETIKLPSEIAPIKAYVDECIKKSVKESIYSISESGGYYLYEEYVLLEFLSEDYGLEENFLSFDDYLFTDAGEIPYYYDKGISKIPNKEKVEEQFSKYIKDSLFFCADFTIFREIGYSIKEGYISINSEISNNNLIVNVRYPIEIIKNESKTQINEFIYSHEFNYDKINDSVSQLVNAVIEEPYYLDLTLLLEQYYSVSVIEYENCTDIYFIVDNESMKQELDPDVIFRFAVRFDNDLCESMDEDVPKKPIPSSIPKENQQPVLEPVSFQSIAVNETLIINTKATDPENDTIFYVASGILKNHIFPLDGVIIFTPDESNKGFHHINVTAVDIYGNHDSEFFNLEVT